jgi:hypothetical protein
MQPESFAALCGRLSALILAGLAWTTTAASAQPYLPLSGDSALSESGGGLHPVDSKATAIVTSSDDRDNATPTGWWDFSGMTDTDINNFVVNNNARPVDIQLEAVAVPRRFTVTFVSNTGAYAKGWWWYYDQDAATTAAFFANNNARPIALKAYDIGSGQIRFAFIAIPNTGADAKTWYWFYNSDPGSLLTFANNNSARLTQINAYVTGGVTKYAAVMISNTGADQRGWWFYTNTTIAALVSAASANNARVTDLDRDPTTGNYSAIMTDCSTNCPAWWWYVGVTAQQVNDVVAQDGARIIDFNSYPGCGALCYSMVLINNSNDITTRVGELLRNGTDGTKGLYLKEVNGPVLANLEEGFVYEPASAIKSFVHVYAMHQVQNGVAHLTDSLVKYQPPVGTSCPGNFNIGSEPLSTVLAEMMRHSDNTRTREATDTYGVSNIINYAAAFGATHTQINHIIGCGGPIPNQTTLTDLATLYEKVANGTLLNATNKATFYGLMPGRAQFLFEGYDWTGLWSTDIPNIINQEAPAGMLTGAKLNFQNQMDLAYKAGNYKICGATCTTYVDHIDIAGWAKIPFCSGSAITYKEYVFGVFITNSTSDTTSGATFTATKAELLREQIRAGLLSCASASKSLDVDGNSQYDALTDGLLLLRYMFGLTGSSLINGAIGTGATRTTAPTTQQYMGDMRLVLDIDGNGQVDALSDGLMLLRYLFGLRGTSLINGAIGAGATRTSATQIEPFIQSLMP